MNSEDERIGTDVRVERWLGRWTEHDEQPRVAYHLHCEVDEEMWQRLAEGAGSYRALRERPTFEVIQRIWERLRSSRAFYENLKRYDGSFRDVNQRALVTQFMGDVTSWLAVTRLYLEAERNTVSRLFGSESSQAKRLKSATSDAFAGSVAYRFLYNLRDYAQHCGPPLGGIEMSHDDGQVTLMLYLDRNTLLAANFDWSRHAQAFLDGAPPQIVLWPLLTEAMTAFEAIDNEALAVQLEHVAGFTADLRDAASRAGPGVGHPMLFSQSGDGNITYVTLPPPEGLNQVDAWIVDQVPVADMRTKVTTIDTPDTQTEANRRAGAVVGAWLRRGPSDELDTLVDEMTHTQDEATVLVAGLVNLSTQMLQIVSLAIGASVEGLIGCFVEPPESGGS